MAEAHPIYSPIVFVGRQRETSMMLEMLHADASEPQSKWILSIHGQGGIGKTQLMRHFAKVADRHHMDDDHHTVKVTHNPVDLYLSQHQTESGVLKSLADQLDKECFGEFYRFLDTDYARVGDEKELRNTFLRCYRKLPVDHIVLLFDTVERASSAVIRFFQEFLPELKDGSEGEFGAFVVTAGRKPLTIIQDTKSTENYALKGLLREDIKYYFEKLTQKRQQRRITPGFIDQITMLSKGRPILIALVIDWLNYGNLPQDFPDSTSSEKEIEQLLVEQVRELRTSEDQSIWMMAHLNRRFDESFLQAILNFPEDEARDIISSLTKFSFVKTHTSQHDNTVTCSLHDEMQDLVKQYVLRQFDPSGDLRKEWSRKAVDHYRDLIARSAAQDITHRQMLERERLFYWLQADTHEGLKYWRTLHKNTHLPYVKESLNEEVEFFEDRLTVEDRLELRFQKAITLYLRSRYDLAIACFSEVIKDTRDEVLKAEIYPLVVYSLTHIGCIEKSLEEGRKYEVWFDGVLGAGHNSHINMKVKRSFGILLNAIGLAHRNKSDYKTAVDYYEKSLQVLKCLPDNSNQRASTKTNLAYLYHSVGDDRKALAHGKSALRIAEDSSNIIQTGLTHNVLGIIAANSLREQQAVNHFNCALDCFTEAQYDRGLALAKIAMGRMHRQIGWYKVKPNREKFEDAVRSYERAAQYFEEALASIGKHNPEIVMDIYYEQATLYREQGDFDKAIKFYQNSKSIADNIPSPLKTAYNLLGLGVTYELQEEYLKSRDAAEEAVKFASLLNSDYLSGRAERILSNVLFKKDKDYDQAIEKAIKSCTEVLSPDPHSFTNSSAKREMLHDEWLDWLIEDLIQNLPSTELQILKSRYLTQCWENSYEEGGLLAKYYPGLKIRLGDLITYSATELVNT